MEAQFPDQPSIFQYYIKGKSLPNSSCQIIASKDKLAVLSNCLNLSIKANICLSMIVEFLAFIWVIVDTKAHF